MHKAYRNPNLEPLGLSLPTQQIVSNFVNFVSKLVSFFSVPKIELIFFSSTTEDFTNFWNLIKCCISIKKQLSLIRTIELALSHFCIIKSLVLGNAFKVKT